MVFTLRAGPTRLELATSGLTEQSFRRVDPICVPQFRVPHYQKQPDLEHIRLMENQTLIYLSESQHIFV